MFAGVEEGVFCALNAILNKGDHYIAQHPDYQSLEEIPRSTGREISQWKLSHNNYWRGGGLSARLSFLISITTNQGITQIRVKTGSAGKFYTILVTIKFI